MNDQKGDVSVLRELAHQYMEICAHDVQKERRTLWRRHNSLIPTRPLVLVRYFACVDAVIGPKLQCKDLFFRQHEKTLRRLLFQNEIGDDWIFEPWLVQPAALVLPAAGPWGMKEKLLRTGDQGGAYYIDAPMKKLEDLSRLVVPAHKVDEKQTAMDFNRINDAVGDILKVIVDRAPHWHSHLAAEVGTLRGLEQMLWDMAERPEWLHTLMGFLRDGVLKAHAEAEAAGDWRLINHENQAMTYAGELPDPSADGAPVTRDRLWCFASAQEMTLVSPAMHRDFMLNYQIPIIEKFGLVAYGCCEDLTQKIDDLRRIPNLRRISVALSANLARCAEQIGRDYVLSYRPNPAEMVCCGFDPNHVRKAIRSALETCRGCIVDITLKDIETVEDEPQRLAEWTRIVREVSEDF